MRKLLIIILISILPVQLFCQETKPFLLGLNPAVTIEPTYSAGSFDVNIFPLVFEYPVISNLDVRVITLFNYGFRNYGSALINVGAELSIPYYVNFSKNKPVVPSGFFVAAGSAFTRNIYYNHNNLSVFLEPGYNFSFNNSFALIIDLQFGKTYFFYDDSSSITGNHFGVKVILGWWFK